MAYAQDPATHERLHNDEMQLTSGGLSALRALLQ